MKFRIAAINLAILGLLTFTTTSIAEVIPEGMCNCTTTAPNPPPTMTRDGLCSYTVCQINEACSGWGDYNGMMVVDLRSCSSEELNPSWPPPAPEPTGTQPTYDWKIPKESPTPLPLRYRVPGEY